MPRQDKSVAELEASIHERASRLLGAVGDPWKEDERFAHYAQALADKQRELPGSPPPRRASPAFLSRVNDFLHAVELALRHMDRSDESEFRAARALLVFVVESIRLGHVRSLSGLAYLESDLIEGWNEGSESEVDSFWRDVRDAGLPYVRRDLLQEIFSQKKIRTRQQYEHAVDQLGLLDPESAKTLSKYIDVYETRESAPRRGRSS